MTTGDAGKVIGVPELPSGVRIPLYAVDNVFGDMYHLGATTWTSSQSEFLVNLINAVYSPGGLKQQLSDLQQRVGELEGELEAEKSNDHWLGEDA